MSEEDKNKDEEDESLKTGLIVVKLVHYDSFYSKTKQRKIDYNQKNS